jgi:hypothetical protein
VRPIWLVQCGNSGTELENETILLVLVLVLLSAVTGFFIATVIPAIAPSIRNMQYRKTQKNPVS